MRQALAFLVLAGLSWLGSWLAATLALPVPGPLLGMVFLLLGLILLGRLPLGLQQASQPLLRHMMLLFIPPVAGIVVHIEPMRGQWLPFVAAGLVGTLLTLAVTVLVFQWALRRFGSDAS